MINRVIGYSLFGIGRRIENKKKRFKVKIQYLIPNTEYLNL
jgi:hypothetical protein